MLSYQHGFHAGNFADVHKHLIVSLIMDYLVQKPAALTVLDVYAGRGQYPLNGAQAQKTGEAEQGILKLWPPAGAPEVASPYVAALTDFSHDLKRYPGSPCLVQHWMRPQDTHVLCELHPAEHDALLQVMKPYPSVHIHKRDAVEALVALTPPQARRGVVLVDPSYEVKDEYLSIARTVRQCLTRWPEATWCIWYPLLSKRFHQPLLDQLQGRGKRGSLVSEISVREPGMGMHGSGMLVINPPWNLADQLKQASPWLAQLGQTQSADIRLKIESTS